MHVDEKQKEIVLLQFFSKKLYNKMLMELGKNNIHSYDVQATAQCTNDEIYQITIQFGEGFGKKLSSTFTHEKIEKLDEAILSFFKECGEKIKETMIQEYYKMMKP